MTDRDTKPLSPAGIAALLEQMSRLIHSAGHAHGLYPAQWSALRYFAEMPENVRTTAALARFQGMAVGPVSRTVRTLVEKGLLQRIPNPRDRRADALEVTARGRDLLADDPHRVLSARIADLPHGHQEVLLDALSALIQGVFEDWKGIGAPAADELR